MSILAIGAATEIVRIPLGPYVGILLGDVESIGFIKYGNVLNVVDERKGQRVLAVAAELNQMAGALGGGSHFICVYDRGTHYNCGASDDYSNRDKFLAKALELAEKHLQQSPAPGSSTPVPDPVPSTSSGPDIPIETRPNAVGPILPAQQPWRKGPPAPRTLIRSSAPERDAAPSRYTDSNGSKSALAGAGLYALGLLLFFVPELPSEGVVGLFFIFLFPAAYFLFFVGCCQAEKPTASAGTWLKAARILAGVTLASSAVAFIVGSFMPELILARIPRFLPAPGFFLLALGCHAVYLGRLAASVGLSNPAQLSWGLAGFLWLLAVARIANSWVFLGHQLQHLSLIGSLVGVGLWGALQYAMKGKVAPPA